MPFLPGGAMVDASGNHIVDASANAITEAGIPVVVTSFGILANNALGGGFLGIDWNQLLSDIAEIAGNLSDIVSGSLEIQAIRNLQDDVNAFMANGGPDTFTGHDPLSHPSLISAEGIINSIGTPPTGGLTEEEHDALLNVGSQIGDVAEDVWTWPATTRGGTTWGNGWEALGALENAYVASALQVRYEGIPVPDRPFWRVHAEEPYVVYDGLGIYDHQFTTDAVPDISLSDNIEDGDTVLSFLEREYPDFNYQLDGPGSWGGQKAIWVYKLTDYGILWYRCTMTDDMLASTRVATIIEGTGIVVDGPPVWPGIDGVTLGTPVALVNGLHMEGEMDGVIIAVTTPPSKTGLRSIGGALYDYGVGEIAFETDQGDIETWQYLGFRAAIFTPKTMTHAHGARLRVLAGAEGTATPWSRS